MATDDCACVEIPVTWSRFTGRRDDLPQDEGEGVATSHLFPIAVGCVNAARRVAPRTTDGWPSRPSSAPLRAQWWSPHAPASTSESDLGWRLFGCSGPFVHAMNGRQHTRANRSIRQIRGADCTIVNTHRQV